MSKFPRKEPSSPSRTELKLEIENYLNTSQSIQDLIEYINNKYPDVDDSVLTDLIKTLIDISANSFVKNDGVIESIERNPSTGTKFIKRRKFKLDSHSNNK
jgi:hypothetical protein